MSSKRNIIFIAGLLFGLTVFVCGLLTGLYFYLPHYLESKIIPQLAAEAGISDFAVNVRNIGIFGADLGPLRIGAQHDPTLLVRSVQIDYSPKGLYRQKIARLALSGIELYGEFKSGKFFLRGFDLEKALTQLQSRKKPIPESEGSMPLISFSKLEIRNSVVIFEIKDRRYRIPFETTVVPEDAAYTRFNIATFLYPRGQKISAEAEIDMTRQRVFFKLAAAALNLGRFADLAQMVAGLGLGGKADMSATADVQWTPFHISALNASVALREGKIRFKNFELQNARNAHKEELPFRINITETNRNQWEVNGSAVAATLPIPLNLSGWGCRINVTGKQVEGSGKFTVTLQRSTVSQNKLLPLGVIESLPLHGKFSAKFGQDGRLQYRITGSGPQKSSAKAARFLLDQYEIATKIPTIDIAGQGPLKGLTTDYTIIVPDVLMTSQTQTIRLPQVVLKGRASLNRDAKGAPMTTFELRCPDTRAKLKAAEINIKDVSLHGSVQTNKKSGLKVDGVLKFAGAGLSNPQLDAGIRGARGTIPLTWPPERQKDKGTVSIATLQYRHMNLGAIKAEIQQTASGFFFEGRHTSRLFPRMSLKFSGDANLFYTRRPATNVHFELLRPADVSEIDLGNFLPAARRIQLKGKFLLSADLVVEGSGFSGSIHSQLTNGELRIKNSDFAIEGIQISLAMPELPKIRSSPGQQLRFARLSLGDLEVKNGSIDFQIESAHSFLIEKTHFLWCDGKVDTQSIRISAGKKDYRVIFYCDRLNLARVLGQFGAAAAKGEGTVNGRIPLRYENGKLSFDDAFLFSTPGQGGKIHLTATQILTAGIAPNTPQHVQMELATEALRDYDYSWAKLNITSEGEDLLLKMQMDGRPAKTLPFVYKKEVGAFVKVDAHSKGSRFQGIRLDVNFRLPLNKILRYKDIVKMIQ